MVLFAVLAVASAQVLRISPASIGSASPSSQQVILLSHGGGVAAAPAAAHSVHLAQPQLQFIQAQPQLQNIRLVAAAPQPQLANIQLVAAQPQPQAVRVVAAPAPAPVTLVSSAASSEAAEVYDRVAPYGFAFESEDEFGTKLGRQESANEQGVVTGQYTLSDATGISRIVTYVADENGFRATVKTNEPGTITSNPADATYESLAQRRRW